MRKHIKIFEEFIDSVGEFSETEYTWQDLRNTMQAKLPFIIIDFQDKASYDSCIAKDLYDERWAVQTYNQAQSENGDMKTYPSVFIFETTREIEDRVKEFFKRFQIYRIIVGGAESDHPTVYIGGSSGDFGNDIVNGTSPSDVGSDNYYQIGSTYYKFINT